MGDVHRLKKEVVGSIGRGTASPVRAMFSREISDGDTLLAGEMVGVDEGLVIQELSRPEELEKLQHELAKQVSKLAELGELKWLEELETLETEELGELLRLKARKASEELRTLAESKGQHLNADEIKSALGLEKLAELELVKQRLESMKELQKAEAQLTAEELREMKERLKALAGRGEDPAGLKKAIEEANADELKKGLEEVVKTLEEKKSELEKKVGRLKLEDLNRLEEIKEVKKKLEEAIRALKEGPELEQMLKGIRLDLEEQLRTLAEIKEVRALAKKRQDGGLELQEILQLTTRTVALERNLAEKVSKLDRKSLERQKKVLEQEKLKLIKELAEKRKAKGLFGAVLDLGLVALGVGETKDWELVILEKKLAKIKALKDKEVVKLERQIERIRGLEDLAVSKKLKAALASAMEMAKNRGWTDYLNSLDVSERANAARELIAAEKIRKWARDINNLDADERAMVAGALTLFLTPSTTV
ncbi:hypothetical protein F0Q58_01660 [Anaplasma marginale]|nr:hypothetical protein F0Q58_01660 [Anaplasma marginale]